MLKIIHCDRPLSLEFAQQLEEAITLPEIDSIQIEFHRPVESQEGEIELVLNDENSINRLRRLLRQMEQAGKPVVALIDTSIADLRLEVALACHRQVASRESVEIQYTWLRFGLMPFLGATQRLPRLIPLRTAAQVLLFGESIPFSQLVLESSLGRFSVRDANDNSLPEDPFSSKPSILQRSALEETPRQPWDRGEILDMQGPKERDQLEQIYLHLRRRSSPAEAAPTAILRCFQEGLERTFDAGLRFEAEQWKMVRHSGSSANRLKTLYSAARSARSIESEGEPVRTLGILGAGLMGTGIAFTAAREGLHVRLVDVSDEALEQAHEKIVRLSRTHPKTKDSPARRQPSELVQLSSNFRELSNCDFIIEAIFEEPELKKSILSKIGEITSAVLASNTTTLPITGLASVCPSPERFIGAHFFAPVDRMDLLEIILGSKTSEQTLKKTLNLALQLGKTPIVVRDGPGFFTSRVVMAYQQEAFLLLSEGVHPWLIDNVAQNAGMQIGPLMMADLTALDLLEKIFESLASEGRGSAAFASRTLPILREFTSRSRFGKKSKAGIYDYLPERQNWPELEAIFPPRSNSPSPDEIEHRLFVIQTIETLHAQKEGIITDPAMMDLGSVLGWSYPAFRGGVASYRSGNPDFEKWCIDLQSRFGARFKIPLP